MAHTRALDAVHERLPRRGIHAIEIDIIVAAPEPNASWADQSREGQRRCSAACERRIDPLVDQRHA
jgi:hypothetical protein